MPTGIYQHKKGRHWKIKDTSKMKGRLNGFKKGCIAWNKGTHIQNNNALETYYENGGKPWNKGLPKEKNPLTNRKHSMEHRKKLSEKAKERIRKGTHNFSQQYGENHPQWKGGITPEIMKLRKSDKYKNWRRIVLIRDEFTCQKCGKNHIYIVAHHIKSFADYPTLRFEPNNGRTLCASCHKRLHNIRTTN